VFPSAGEEKEEILISSSQSGNPLLLCSDNRNPRNIERDTSKPEIPTPLAKKDGPGRSGNIRQNFSCGFAWAGMMFLHEASFQ
jgi:hypothetical protein